MNTLSNKVRDYFKLSWVADVLIMAVMFLIVMSFARFIQASSMGVATEAEIHVQISALPSYALLSLVRSLIALVISFAFAIVYGNLAASGPRAESIMIPALDVLQSLPVLTFLPGFILVLTALFPNSRWGLEFSCILMIFTGQVWNLVFGYWEALRNMPRDFRDVVSLAKLSRFKRFLLLDLPSANRPLVYNGMMSMAGGWVFLTLCESFKLGDKNFRVPGLGSFLGAAFDQQNYVCFIAGVCCLFAMILSVDFILWKPLIAWSAEVSDKPSNESPKSLVYEFYQQSQILPALGWVLIQVFELVRRAQRSLYRLWRGTKRPWQQLPRLKPGLPKPIMQTMRGLPWVQWGVSFGLGSLIFLALPRLPQFARVLSLVKSEHWFSLIDALLHTAIKIFSVLVIATLWTVPVGLWVGRNPKVGKIAAPIIQNLAAFPMIMLYPLITMVLHTAGIPAGVVSTFLMLIGNQWYLLFNVISGAMQIPSDLSLVGNMCQFSWRTRWRRLYIPALLPSLVTGWITAAGGAWNASIVAEFVPYPGGILLSPGIGAEIFQATEKGDYLRLGASIVVITVALVVINRSVWRTLSQYCDKVKLA